MALAGHMGMMFTAKDAASATIMRVDKNLGGLAATSEATAAVYNASMLKIRKGIVALSIAIVGLMALAKVTKTFGEFQYTLASAGVIMGATTGEMRQLERAAIDAGIATQFSPREAAEGLQALGASGMNATDAMKALNPVLDLAAASMGQLGVGGAAQVTAGVLNSFSMSAERAGAVADKLTRISQLTNFQFKDFGIAISQAGAQAAAADQTFESMLATLGMLRNTNLHASAAATAYREAVRRLSGDKRAHKELSKLSVEVLDKETGKIRDLGSILGEVAPKLEALNSKEKGLILTRIFGVRGMKTYSSFVAQYNKLVKEGKVAVGDYSGAHRRLVIELNNASGAAKKNRDALLETAEGQRLLLKGSWETTQIMLGKLALPAILPMLKAMTGTLNIFIKLLDMIPGPVRNLIGSFAGAFLAFKALKGMTLLLQGAFGMLKIGQMAAGMGTVATSATTATTAVSTLGKTTGGIRGMFTRLGGAIAGMLGPISLVASAAFALYSYFKGKADEEKQRQIEIREQNRRSKESYRQAWKMARALRKETARAWADELKLNAKTEAGAVKVLDKFRAKYVKLLDDLVVARRKIRLEEVLHGKTSAQANKARAMWLEISGREEGARAAMSDAEARREDFRIRRIKDKDEREVAGGKIVANRMLREMGLRQGIANFRKIQHRMMEGLTGKALRVAQRRFKRREAVAMQRLRHFRAETARWAVRWGLLDKDVIKRKGWHKKLGLLVTPAKFRPPEAGRQQVEWTRALKAGKVPELKTVAERAAFSAFLERTRAGAKPGELPRMEAVRERFERREAGAPVAPTMGVELPQFVTPLEREMEKREGVDLGEQIQRAITTARTEMQQAVTQRPIITQVLVDGKVIAETVARYQDQDERDRDGTQGVTGKTRIAGAG